MKKFLFVLVALMFAAPAMAAIDIEMAQVADTNEVIISITSDEANLIRAYGLNIKLTQNTAVADSDPDPNILEVTALNPGYWVFPGTIQIDPDGNVTNLGSPVAEYGDLPSDTLAGLDSNGVTVELASLYAPVIPDSPNAPAQNGALLSVKVSGSACMTITANVARAGAKGVVMEDPDEDPTVNIQGELCFEVASDECECYGDYTGDIVVDSTDMSLLLMKLFEKVAADPQYTWDPVPEGWLCMDLDGNEVLDSVDMSMLLMHLFTYPPDWVAPCYPAP